MPAIATLSLSKPDARSLLTKHHFVYQTAADVFEHLGSIQFDPLNPVGCNHDLVLQARVEDYQLDDWQKLAYNERKVYDFWDKQASLVRMKDWPKRRIFHEWHRKAWEEKVFKPFAELIPRVLAELKERGPLTSSAFSYQPHIAAWEGSWYGPKLTKNILRALWHTGQVVTHSRKHGHHVYDLPERVIPESLLHAEPSSERDSLDFLIKLRHKAVGLLRPNAGYELWGVAPLALQRKKLIEDLLKSTELRKVLVEAQVFHALPETLELLDSPALPARMIFLAPLDQLVWDRKALLHLYDFDYLWEVYKPEKKRKWGYYVLPVFYKDRLVARFDSRLKDSVWELYRWYWEAEIKPDTAMLGALEQAVARFKRYLRAESIRLPQGLDKATRGAWQRGEKL